MKEVSTMYWHGGMGGWGFLWMLLNSIVLWGLLAAGAVLLWRAVQGRPASPGAGADETGGAARRLLADRYARGEINEEEYRRRLAVLRHG
jgi:putative membrane protein